MVVSKHKKPMSNEKKYVNLVMIYFSVFLDFLAQTIIQPILPFYAAFFGANALKLGYIYAAYEITCTIACFIFGGLSDHFGRRPLILCALFGTAIGLTASGLAFDFWLLFFARLLNGIFGGSTPVAQAYVTDITRDNDIEQRTRYLNFVQVAMAFALFGPALGSSLAEFGLRVPFFVAGMCCLI